jgi:hypothetical protein
MIPKRSDLIIGDYCVIWRTRKVLIYYFLAFIMIYLMWPRLIMSIQISEGVDIDLLPWGILILIIIAPFMSRNLSHKYASKNINERKKTEYQMDENGLAYKSDLSSGYVNWQAYSSIQETKRFIIFNYSESRPFFLFKNCLPCETLKQIKELLAKIEGPKVKLLSSDG